MNISIMMPKGQEERDQHIAGTFVFVFRKRFGRCGWCKLNRPTGLSYDRRIESQATLNALRELAR